MYPLKLYLRHPITIGLLFVSIVLNLASWGWLLGHIEPGADAVFLHYNILFGVDAIGTWSQMLLVPLGGLLIILINAAIGWTFFQQDKYLAHVMNTAAFLCQIFVCIATVLLVALNI